MSEHYSHIAVYEDTVTLIKNSNEFPPLFQEAFNKAYDSGLNCSSSRGNHLWAVPILEKYKAGFPANEPEEEILMKIAGALGWLTHRGADLVVKPVLRKIKAAQLPGFDEQECSVYFDAEVFRQVYDSGRRSTRSPYHLISPFTFAKNFNLPHIKTSQSLEEVFTYYWLTELAGLNDFVNNEKNGTEWGKKMKLSFQEFSEDYRSYIQAFTAPSDEKTQKYLIETNYYNPEDILLKRLRNSSETVVFEADLIESGKNGSLYAQCVQRSYSFVSEAARYFTNQISKKELYERIEIYGDQQL